MEKQEIINELKKLKATEIIELVQERERQYLRRVIREGIKKGAWNRSEIARLLKLDNSTITRLLGKAK
jgi:Mn-dependent DtxR family transcriptional regulator